MRMASRPAPHRLYAVRHARPLIAEGICYGQLDSPADLDATAACAAALATELPGQARLICSPLQRCEQLTLILLGLRPDLTLKIDSRLREMDFGAWEGCRWDDIGADAVDAWVRDFAQHRPGGGETVAGFLDRVAAMWDETYCAPKGTTTVWITHAGVIRAATLLQRGVRQIAAADEWPLDAPGFGQWRAFD
jgi:alpha-ribazole phosphatase